MQEVTINAIKRLLFEEIQFIEKMNSIREEILQYGYYKSFTGGDLERIAIEGAALPEYVQYPYGVVAVQESGPFFCRGESKIFPTSRSTWDRCMPKDKKEKSIYSFVENMRWSELSMFFGRLRAVECCRRSEFNFTAVVQHYGFKTNFLDITNRLRIALFFACCVTEKDKSWRPLNKFDLIEKDSVDGRYGVIFIRDRFECGTNLVMPIGYQPFLRCHSQYGYFISMRNGWDLKDKALGFTAFYFKHDEEFCRYIFNLNEGGKLIYPDNTDSIFLPALDKIRDTKVFSRKAFEVIYAHRREIPFPFQEDYTEEMLIEELGNICIIENELVSNNEISDMNEKWCSTCISRKDCGMKIDL